MYKQMRVFRVYFRQGHRPYAGAEFEMVALPMPTATDALRFVTEVGDLNGWRLVCWPDPEDRNAKLVDRIHPITLTRQTVESIRTSRVTCKIRPSNDLAPLAEAAE